MKNLSLLFATLIFIGLGASSALAGDSHRVDEDCLDISCYEYDYNTYVLGGAASEEGYYCPDTDKDYDSDKEYDSDKDGVIKGGF